MVSRNRNVISILNEDGIPKNANLRIRPGMVMAQDVFNERGFLICSTNTRLNDHLVDILADSGIRWAKVYSDENEDGSIDDINEDLIDSTVIHTEEFQEFKQEYSQKVTEVKEQLTDISSG